MDLLEEGISTINDQATDIKRAESFSAYRPLVTIFG